MKRFHIQFAVENLAESIDFYNKLPGEAATIVQPGYAKWMPDDPGLKSQYPPEAMPVASITRVSRWVLSNS
ncbi:MAG: hypothetical protein ACN4GM_07385 [Gammaproteobacteria bacterium]